MARNTATTERSVHPNAPEAARDEMVSYQQRIQQRSPIVVDGVDPDSAEFVTPTDAETMKAALASAEYVAPVFIKLGENQDMRAIYIGKGSHTFADEVNERTGEVLKEGSTVSTYMFQRGKVQGWILGAYELDKAMANIPADGSMIVHVFKGKDEKNNGRNISRYRVLAERNPAYTPPKAELPEKAG